MSGISKTVWGSTEMEAAKHWGANRVSRGLESVDKHRSARVL